MEGESPLSTQPRPVVVQWTPPGDAHPIPLRLYVFGAYDVVAAAWAILVLVASFAALLPANRAARLAIVDALRHV